MSDKKLSINELTHVKRFELIDDTGRVYSTYGVEDMELWLQDNNTTLKLFLKTDKNATYQDWNDVAYGKDSE